MDAEEGPGPLRSSPRLALCPGCPCVPGSVVLSWSPSPPAFSPSASKGLIDAAHFCYLMAQVGFGVYTKKTAKLVLIGSNHR